MLPPPDDVDFTLETTDSQFNDLDAEEDARLLATGAWPANEFPQDEEPDTSKTTDAQFKL